MFGKKQSAEKDGAEINGSFFDSGSIGCVWYLFWVLIVREGPEKDKNISKDELRYIQAALGTSKKPNIKHPWGDIFTSKPVYAISASHFAENWGFYTLLTQLPTFLKGSYSEIPLKLHYLIQSVRANRHAGISVGESRLLIRRSVSSNGCAVVNIRIFR